MPHVKKVTKDGKTIIEPSRWTFKDAANMLAEASSLARRATGLTEDERSHQQLSALYSTFSQILLLDDSQNPSKEIVRACLDSLLLQAGKPIPEVIQVLETERNGRNNHTSPADSTKITLV